MTNERALLAASVAVLVGLGVVSWWLQLRQPLHVVPATLEGIPIRIAGFEGIEGDLEDRFEEILKADYNLQRMYVNAEREKIFLYVGYYGTDRGGTPEHTPEVCYQGQGYRIFLDGKVLIDPATDFWARELLVEGLHSRELVVFWYRSSRRSGMASTTHLRLDHIASELTSGRGDGALVRLSMPLEGRNVSDARASLVAFARVVDHKLGAYWPVEYRSRARDVTH